MKKVLLSLIMVATVFFFTSCGINYSMVMNHNINNTQVHLSNNNFKVVDKVVGSSSTFYVLCFGDMNHTQLYQQAYSAMMDKANLKDASKAVINVVYEEHLGGAPPFYFKRTVTISGNVVEFNR